MGSRVQVTQAAPQFLKTLKITLRAESGLFTLLRRASAATLATFWGCLVLVHQRATMPPDGDFSSGGNMKLSKTDFLIYRDCKHNAWVKIHRPEVYRAGPLSAFDLGLLETGNEVDALAQELYPNGTVVRRGDAATTARLIAQQEPILYQPVFETDQFTTACDILVWNAAAERYDLYEVKASTIEAQNKARDEEYLYDLGFQAEVMRQCGVPLGRLNLVRLNSAYVRGLELDLGELFAIYDLTDDIGALRDQIAHEMDAASELLGSVDPLPSPCSCIWKGRNSHCTTFAFTNPQVPEYSVHDISRIGSSKKKLADLINAGVLDIRDISDDFKLTFKQENQVRAAKTGQSSIDGAAIAAFLDRLEFPLAFFDYETYPAAVPRFKGYGPYHQIPFQFSLDVIKEPGGEIEHFEFLHTEPTCPDAGLIDALRRSMPTAGAVVTWNKSFEMGINSKLAERNPEAREFLSNLNDRVVDLMDVFSQQAYVNPEFRGRTSIKAILPVLVPGLSYKALEIQEGATATAKWNELVTGAITSEEAERVSKNLLDYCALDTLAMVEIWRALGAIAKDSRRVA